MKFFRQLLLAPVALGLMAPVAATAGEMNLDGINQYAASEDQVTSITQFSDVQPTEWAYQALSNLIERYGCVAGYPDGTFRGKKPLSRWEAAALLNACLDRITEVTDELRRLLKEFEKELAILRGRVDNLEAKVGELEANQFSTTTKLRGVATFTIGANSFGGSARVLGDNTGLPNSLNPTLADVAAAQQGATAFNYNLDLFLDTSFTGKDLLRTRLRAGNFGSSPWGAANPDNLVGLNAFEIAFEGASGADSVEVNRLFYQFPLGSSFTATVGAKVRQDDMLAFWPSVYPADTVLDIFTYGGAPGAYPLTLGSGGGLWWKSGGFSISANYVAVNGNVGNPNIGGIGTDGSAQTGTAQIAWNNENFGIAAAYTYTTPQGGLAGLYGGNGTPLANLGYALSDSVNSVGISGYWQPSNSGWLPSISTGWGLNAHSSDTFDQIDGAQTQSWYVGLQWSDVFIKGNSFGMAVGQPTFFTKSGDGDIIEANDGNYAWEWWYKFQVTDNISITPALFYLSVPLGQLQKNSSDTFDNFGGLVKTTFKF
ncbi:carbohydrate porin [Synechococcus sp. Cruz-9H2]|uniref:iron uptake porin n=1 Tax=unclassified Synechococcus TaxID=2626047 RepID=UPI0020CE4527|nr:MULTISPECIES: iron uptake porin [unclassified Synechococcus]MCP9820826.1 carbohydrate porin [Synechococcus sp. Cruz-9H2]MCP9845028.1 carbohydrate porin [Synechococcus sp. Edmonson 11F2]MCP9857182.1 carbohydrate porin [Synechococcus sp. Cruz-9C9]MCP9864434.1 carbohydrate porin [Synechococcus sp. Cruz-7E5]MCP9871736.1 carbohydrate porin [Synechococcus sp. Cruz-7B9]